MQFVIEGIFILGYTTMADNHQFQSVYNMDNLNRIELFERFHAGLRMAVYKTIPLLVFRVPPQVELKRSVLTSKSHGNISETIVDFRVLNDEQEQEV